MRTSGIALASAMLCTFTAVAADEVSTGQDICPVTLGTDELLKSDSRGVYGSDSLAVSLPPNGTVQVTGPNGLIAIKLFWRSAGFRPGMEQQLRVKVVNLHDGPNDAVVSEPTNANWSRDDFEAREFDDEWLDSWMMLTGIDFPSVGCWEITGEYLGQSLTFVVETVERPGET